MGFSLAPSPVSARTPSKETSKASENDSDESAEENEENVDKASSSDEEEKDTSDEEKAERAAEEEARAKRAADAVLTVDKLPAKLNGILKPATRNAEWGVKVVLAETGQTLFESGADDGLIPASNRKLFTGALALDQLGPDFKFRTYLYKTGNVDAQGTLNGNLVIVPSGDPTFSKEMYKAASGDWVYRDWAKKVQEAGIKNITGDLLVDCSAWDMNDMNPRGWPDRFTNDYPQTSPLTISENMAVISLTPGKSGEPASVSYSPPATGYPVVNKTESGKQGSPVAKRIINSHIGGVPSKKSIWSFPIDRPTLFAAANFRHHLMENQIPIQGSVRIITATGVLPGPNQQNTIAMVESPRLIDIVDYMMKKSDNHMAEQIYVAVSSAKMGKGSYTNSWRLEADLLSRAQINPAGVHGYDGSGLSEGNRVTPTDVCKLLSYMLSHPYAQQYYDSMAISGRDGTLRNRMGSIAGRVHAKTGTINGVKALSGYVKLASDKTVSFSFLVNQIKGGSPSGIHDRLCSTIAALVL
jgi:PBP4 family serine-type D-alanyl-D-alanine carboxypeptidase